MNNMDLKKIIGQLVVCGFDGTTPSKEIKELIQDYKVGSVILFTRNIGSTADVLRLTTELQLMAKEAGHERPLLICVDQENGIVRRLGTGTTVFPGAMLLGATGNPENAYYEGLATGAELKSLGINWNLAPVVDVNNNPLNPVIGVRSYSEDPAVVTKFAREAVGGMRQAGVITTLKHFPGHGDTDVDSHLNLPVVPYNMERLKNVELMPYRELIAEGMADTIMSAHIYFPSIEKNKGVPATLSRDIITGLLRQQLGYNGVVTTDCLEMNAIRQTVGTVNGAIAAIKAGIDIVMISHTYELQKSVLEALVREVETGGISRQTIDDAYSRVCALKDRYLSWKDIPSSLTGLQLPKEVGGKHHRELAEEIYRQGVTIYRNEGMTIPVTGESKVLVIYPAAGNVTMVEDVHYSACSLGNAVTEVHPGADTLTISVNPDKEEIKAAVEKAEGYGTIIAGTHSAVHNPGQAELVNSLLKKGLRVIAVAMKSPYDITCFKDVQAYIATYEHSYPALRQAARAIFGLDEVKGEMPVTIP